MYLSEDPRSCKETGESGEGIGGYVLVVRKSLPTVYSGLTLYYSADLLAALFTCLSNSQFMILCPRSWLAFLSLIISVTIIHQESISLVQAFNTPLAACGYSCLSLYLPPFHSGAATRTWKAVQVPVRAQVCRLSPCG